MDVAAEALRVSARLGPLLLGPLFLERFDVAAAVLAATGLALLRRRPAASARDATASGWPS